MKKDDNHPDGFEGGLPSRDDTAGLRVPVRDENREPPSPITRRTVLKLMAASAALSLGTGCDRKPYRQIVSMADTPEYQHPGIPLYYASTWTDGPVSYGMMVKTLDGRPVKIEGLPAHPLNGGTSSAAMQASILSLYDPDRLRAPLREGAAVTWDQADKEIAEALRTAKSVTLITRSVLGPSELDMIQRFIKACPGEARHLWHETVHDTPRRRAWVNSYGTPGEVRPRLDRARVILSIDSDFLGTDGDVLRQSRHFAALRGVDGTGKLPENLPRLYVAESAMTVTGSSADHRIPVRPSQVQALLKALIDFASDGGAGLESAAAAIGCDRGVLKALAGDLHGAKGEALVLAGSHLPAPVHAAVAVLNDGLDAPGKTLEWNPAPAAMPVFGPGEITAALEGGTDIVILMGVNPVHDWPGGGFEDLLSKANLTIGHGLHRDETLAACTFALPSTHNLESWNDTAPVAGLQTLCQPVIAPLYDARQEAESLLRWTRLLAPDDESLAKCEDWHDFVRERWQTIVLGGATDKRAAWEGALRSGIAGVPEQPAFPALRRNAALALAESDENLPTGAGGLDLVVLPHHALHDGRFAGNAWLQEFPDPVSKLVWDNAVAIGPATAERLGLVEGDLAAVERDGVSVTLPVLVQPGTAPDTAVVTLGHGRTMGGDVANNKGVNTAPLIGRGSTPRCAAGIKVVHLSGGYELVRIQKTFDMHGRPIVIHGTAKEHAADPAFVTHRQHSIEKKQLHGAFDYSEGHKWVMAVDLNACTGCGACMIACQAENNIPVVGKEECGLGREMSWMRIDRYEAGDPENPRVYQQPMACQHCDNAPCENVCPVNATAHSHEGLNEQVYNRCVGTRYCANNCPYKVRRFNFYNYVKWNLKDSVQELAYNPQVTVRTRGVMEKCTFCVQRINEAKFRAKNDVQDQGFESIPDGAVQPACAQACPAGAIVFGDANDPASRVKAVRASKLAYNVLDELNVQPNIAYLARVRNPHPDIPDPVGDAAHGAGAHGAHGAAHGDHHDAPAKTGGHR